jgi:ribosomal protein S27AE
MHGPGGRPIGTPVFVDDFTIRLRPGALQCVRCGQALHQHEAQPTNDGIRFVCGTCGLDLLEVSPS